MTDRIKGFTVVLEKNFREDDVETIKNAIEMIRGVSKVESIVAEAGDYIIEHRTKSEIREKFLNFLKEI